jgi:hypothetical protein
MQESVVVKYGKGNCDVKIDNLVTMRRHHSIPSDVRLSDMSMVSDVDGRSRVSSLTKSQVASLRQFTASFNFTTSPSLNSKSNLNSNTKSLMMPQTKSLTTTPALNHKKSFKITKEKRRSAKSDCTPSPSVISGATQWYTTEDITNGTPIFELTEEVCFCTSCMRHFR